MDPQAAWEALREAYLSGDWSAVAELAEALELWLVRGGFPPQVFAAPSLGRDFDRAVARAACRYARDKARHKLRAAALGPMPPPEGR